MGFNIFEDATHTQTIASKETGPRPAVKIGVPNGFTEISKPVRLNTSRSSSPAPCHQTCACTLQQPSAAQHARPVPTLSWHSADLLGVPVRR
jgi:hypothetical protein